MLFPRHQCGLYLTHNEHRDYHKTVYQWLQSACPDDSVTWAEGERAKAICADEMWVLQWYPHTPIGFHRAAASTLEKCLEEALRVEREGE